MAYKDSTAERTTIKRSIKSLENDTINKSALVMGDKKTQVWMKSSK